MIVLDTTVLVYATGTHHRFREPCRRLVRAVADAELTATTSVEVIQEFAMFARNDRVARTRRAWLATSRTYSRRCPSSTSRICEKD